MDSIEPSSLLGAISAAGCGLGIRHFSWVVGTGVGAVAAVVSLCLLALVDGAASV